MNRGFTSRAAAIALCASVALLLPSCSEENRDEIRSNVSDAISSVSASPPSLPSISEAPEPTETLRERIGDFNGALRALQIKLEGQPGSATDSA